MKSSFHLFAVVRVACAGLALAACAAGASSTFSGAASGSGANGGAGGGLSTAAGLGGQFATSSTSTGNGAGATYAYAHTDTDLYQFDPSAATITMTHVGTFDCIGGGSTSSGGAPTSCGQFGSGGCCLGNTNYYCSSNAVKAETCKSGESCTWDASKGYYGCASGSQQAAPGDNPPIACGGGSSSTGGGTQDSSMTDLAVDSSGKLWGVSEHNAYQLVVQGGAVHCATTISLQNVPATFYALSFVPAGVIDPSEETLLAGDTAGDLWRIDQTTGALEQHGNFGAVPASDGHGHDYPSDSSVTGTVGTPWQLSGDIVFLQDTSNNTTVGFATVRDCSGSTCSDTDTLVQIDPGKLGPKGTAVTTNVTLGLRGQIVKSASCTDTTNATYGKMFGIAAWDSTIYGFSHDSYIVEVSNVDGSACAVTGQNTNQAWSGAAVTTLAPVKPPPPPIIQ